MSVSDILEVVLVSEEVLEDRVAAINRSLGLLPAVVRYFDDFGGMRRSIRDLSDHSQVSFSTDGHTRTLDFSIFASFEPVMKRVFVDCVGRLDPTSVLLTFESVITHVRRVELASLAHLVTSEMFYAKQFWRAHIFPCETPTTAASLRTVLHSLCRGSIGAWTPERSRFVRTLKGKSRQKFRSVKDGSTLIPATDMKLIVDAINSVATRLEREHDHVSNNELLDAAVTSLSLSRGLRPGQIALVETADVDVTHALPHLSIRHTKQRKQSFRKRSRIRLVKQWIPLIREVHRRRTEGEMPVPPNVSPRLFFGLKSDMVSRRIRRFTRSASRTGYTPNKFRHSFAQRNADSGMARSHLSHLMMHESGDIISVYYTSSPLHAAKINVSMANSASYGPLRTLAKSAHYDPAIFSRSGSAARPQTGYPIPGLGTCRAAGLCGLHPAAGCFVCHRFIPASEMNIHRIVAEAFRTVVADFQIADDASPRHREYLQLAPVLANAEALASRFRDSALDPRI